MDVQTLNQQLQSGDVSYDDFEKRYNELKQQLKEFQQQLEYAVELKKEEKRFETLLHKVAGKNAAELIDSLSRLGYVYKRDLGDAFSNIGYRLLEQTRACKRADVHYSIMRIFVSYNRKFPENLLEAFKPYYSDEMFKIFIFSFLSGIIGKENQSAQ